MDVQIQARAKPLYERDGPRVKLAYLAALLRRLLVVARELLGMDARQRAEHLAPRASSPRAAAARRGTTKFSVFLGSSKELDFFDLS
jgi:hypothetical protein